MPQGFIRPQQQGQPTDGVTWKCWELTPPARNSADGWLSRFHHSWGRCVLQSLRDSLTGPPHSCLEREPTHSHISSPNAHWVSWDYVLNKLVALKSLTQNLLWWEPTLSKTQGLQNLFSIRERIPSLSQIPLQLLPPCSATLDPNIPQNVACPCLSKQPRLLLLIQG